MELIADTTFLVGLWRRQAWATSFARRNASKSLGVPWVVLGEFWNGAVRAGHDPWRVAAFLDIGNPIMEPGPVIAVYARLCADLQTSRIYSRIGQNDLWIGAVAISRNLPLVSKNRRHFAEFPGLRLEVLE